MKATVVPFRNGIMPAQSGEDLCYVDLVLVAVVGRAVVKPAGHGARSKRVGVPGHVSATDRQSPLATIQCELKSIDKVLKSDGCFNF